MLTTTTSHLSSVPHNHDDRYLVACSASTRIAGSPPPPPRLSASPSTAHSSIATQLAELRAENETLKRSLILQSQSSHSLATHIDDLESRLHGAESAARTATANARSLAAKLTDQERLWALERAALEAELETTHEKMARLRATSPVATGNGRGQSPSAGTLAMIRRSMSAGPPRSPNQQQGGEGLGQVSASQKHEQTIAKLITTQRHLERQVEELTTTLRMTQSAHSSALTLAREKSSLVDSLTHDLDELHAVISELRDQNEGYRLLLEERTLRGEWSWGSGASSTSRTASPTAAAASLSSSPHGAGRGGPGSGALRKRMSNVSIKGSLSSELARARPAAAGAPAVVETRDVGVGSPPRTSSTAVGCSPPPGSGLVGMTLSRRASRAVLVKTPVLPEDEVDLELNTVPVPQSILSVVEASGDEAEAPEAVEPDPKRDTEIERLSTELRAMQLYVTTILSRILPSSLAGSTPDPDPPAATDLPSPAASTHDSADPPRPPHSHSLADWYSRRTDTSPTHPPSHSTAASALLRLAGGRTAHLASTPPEYLYSINMTTTPEGSRPATAPATPRAHSPDADAEHDEQSLARAVDAALAAARARRDRDRGRTRFRQARKRAVQPWFAAARAGAEGRDAGEDEGEEGEWGDGGMWGSGTNKAQALSGSLAGVAMEDEVVSATLEGAESASGSSTSPVKRRSVRGRVVDEDVSGSKRPESGSGLLSWLFGGGEDDDGGEGDNRRSSSFL